MTLLNQLEDYSHILSFSSRVSKNTGPRAVNFILFTHCYIKRTQCCHGFLLRKVQLISSLRKYMTIIYFRSYSVFHFSAFQVTINQNIYPQEFCNYSLFPLCSLSILHFKVICKTSVVSSVLISS